MNSFDPTHGESAGGIARAIEALRIAEDAASLRRLPRFRLRAAMLAIDRLLEELEQCNLQGSSRSISAWHCRVLVRGRLKYERWLELNGGSSPQLLMDQLFDLQERLMRDLAGPQWSLSVDDEGSTLCTFPASPRSRTVGRRIEDATGFDARKRGHRVESWPPPSDDLQDLDSPRGQGVGNQ